MRLGKAPRVQKRKKPRCSVLGAQQGRRLNTVSRASLLLGGRLPAIDQRESVVSTPGLDESVGRDAGGPQPKLMVCILVVGKRRRRGGRGRRPAAARQHPRTHEFELAPKSGVGHHLRRLRKCGLGLGPAAEADHQVARLCERNRHSLIVRTRAPGEGGKDRICLDEPVLPDERTRDSPLRRHPAAHRHGCSSEPLGQNRLKQPLREVRRANQQLGRGVATRLEAPHCEAKQVASASKAGCFERVREASLHRPGPGGGHCSSDRLTEERMCEAKIEPSFIRRSRNELASH
jgi:hypothetical protein